MGVVLTLEGRRRGGAAHGASAEDRPDCEIMIFPGVRIERHGLDLGHRLRDSAGRDDFDGIGHGHLPRQTS